MAERPRAQRRRLPALALAVAVVSPLAAQAPPGPPPPAPIVRLAGAPSGSPDSRPETPQAQRPAPVPVTGLDTSSRSVLDGAPSVSLTIAQPMPLREILRLLLAATPLSVVFDEQAGGDFEGDLRSLTLRQALEAVLFPRGLDYDVSGTLVRVFPRRPETRMFDVNYLNVRRAWQRDLATATGIPPGPGTSLRASIDSDPLGEMAEGVRRLLSEGGRAHVDRGAGIVHVTDFADRLDRVGVYLQAVEERASRQVRLEARVLAITLRDPEAAAVDWDAAVARAGAAVSAPRASAGLHVRDLAALLAALGEQGTVRTLAAPRIVAMHNEPALMRVGLQQVYFEPASRLVDTRAVVPASVLEGLTITVTAQVAADGMVLLHIAPSLSERAGEARADRGLAVPVLRVMEADSTMRIRDGHTAVIAGLLDERTRTRPAEGFSGLFGAERHEPVRSELVVLLTPTVVSAAAAAGGQ